MIRKYVFLNFAISATISLGLASEETSAYERTLWQRLTSTYRVIANGFHDNLFAQTGCYASLPSFKKLVQAVALHDLQEVKRLVGQYSYLVYAGDNGGSTALLCAAYYGHLDAVRFLLHLGAPVNRSNMFNATPLHAAAYRGYLDVLACLLDQGADPNTLSTSLGTPLHAAVSKGYVKVIRFLLRNGADPEVQDIKGRVPFHHAIISKEFNWRTLKVLVEVAGTTTDVADTDNRTPIGYAWMHTRGWGRIEFLLARGARVTVKDMIVSPNATIRCPGIRAIKRMKSIRKDALKSYYKELKSVTQFSEQGLNLLILTFTFYDCPSKTELEEN